jgi:hypothetical protein
MNTTRSSRERMKCTCLNQWHTQGSSNYLSRIRIKAWILGSEEEELKFWISRNAFLFWVANSKELLGRAFTGQVRQSSLEVGLGRTSLINWTSLVGTGQVRWDASGSRSQIEHVRSTGQVRWGSLGAGHGPDKSGGETGHVWYLSLEFGKTVLESGGLTGQVQWNLENWILKGLALQPLTKLFWCIPLNSTVCLWLK